MDLLDEILENYRQQAPYALNYEGDREYQFQMLANDVVNLYLPKATRNVCQQLIHAFINRFGREGVRRQLTKITKNATDIFDAIMGGDNPSAKDLQYLANIFKTLTVRWLAQIGLRENLGN